MQKEVVNQNPAVAQTAREFVTKFLNQGYAIIAYPCGGLGVFIHALRTKPETKIYRRIYSLPDYAHWLSTKECNWAYTCLRMQRLDPDNYINPATVHGDWKKRLWQGVCYPVASIIINPRQSGKPPSRAECEEFILNVVFQLLERR